MKLICIAVWIFVPVFILWLVRGMWRSVSLLFEPFEPTKPAKAEIKVSLSDESEPDLLKIVIKAINGTVSITSALHETDNYTARTEKTQDEEVVIVFRKKEAP
ncbi:MAG: hypothetical protein U0411_01235 [Thermodesulfovibrionales bacterium]